MLTERFRYWAFISYSHTDRSWADWLHNELQNFEIRTDVALRAPAAAPRRDRLEPVFLDRAHLPATHDLEEAIRQALRESLFLIVIASPHSARSARVSSEIQFFSAEHGTRNILAFLAGGHPNAVECGHASEDECLPEPLRNVAEPRVCALRVADARSDRSRGDAFLSLASYLTGADLSILSRRNRLRKVAMLAATAIVLGSFLATAAHWLSPAIPGKPCQGRPRPTHSESRTWPRVETPEPGI